MQDLDETVGNNPCDTYKEWMYSTKDSKTVNSSKILISTIGPLCAADRAIYVLYDVQ